MEKFAQKDTVSEETSKTIPQKCFTKGCQPSRHSKVVSALGCLGDQKQPVEKNVLNMSHDHEVPRKKFKTNPTENDGKRIRQPNVTNGGTDDSEAENRDKIFDSGSASVGTSCNMAMINDITKTKNSVNKECNEILCVDEHVNSTALTTLPPVHRDSMSDELPKNFFPVDSNCNDHMKGTPVSINDPISYHTIEENVLELQNNVFVDKNAQDVSQISDVSVKTEPLDLPSSVEFVLTCRGNEHVHLGILSERSGNNHVPVQSDSITFKEEDIIEAFVKIENSVPETSLPETSLPETSLPKAFVLGPSVAEVNVPETSVSRNNKQIEDQSSSCVVLAMNEINDVEPNSIPCLTKLDQFKIIASTVEQLRKIVLKFGSLILKERTADSDKNREEDFGDNGLKDMVASKNGLNTSMKEGMDQGDCSSSWGRRELLSQMLEDLKPWEAKLQQTTERMRNEMNKELVQRQKWIDSSRNNGFSKCSNDDHQNPNSRVMNLQVDGNLVPVFSTNMDIVPGTELHYNYGNKDYPWRGIGSLKPPSSSPVGPVKMDGGASNFHGVAPSFSPWNTPSALDTPSTPDPPGCGPRDRKKLKKLQRRQRIKMKFCDKQLDFSFDGKADAVTTDGGGDAASQHPVQNNPHAMDDDEPKRKSKCQADAVTADGGDAAPLHPVQNNLPPMDDDEPKRKSKCQADAVTEDGGGDAPQHPVQNNLHPMDDKEPKRKIKCPVCGVLVVNLPRHMRSRLPGHKWNKQQSLYTKVLLGLKKIRNTEKVSSKKRYIRPLKPCPEKGCYALVKRLDQHMKSIHARPFKINNIFYNAEQLKPIHDREKFTLLMEEFHKWQMSGDGNLVTKDTALRQREQFARVVKGLHCMKFSNILDVGKANSFLSDKHLSGEWSCGTITSYLFSIIGMMLFLRSISFNSFFEDHGDLFDLTLPEISEKAGILREACSRWTRTYTKRNKEHLNDKYELERSMLVTPEERRVCLTGPMFKKVMKLKKAFKNNTLTTKTITCSDFLTVRNYLLLYIYASRGHRTGLVSKLRMEQFKNVSLIENGKKVVLDAPRHRTSATHGCGRVILTRNIHTIFQFYCDHIRPYAVTVSDLKMPFLFTTRDGQKLSTASATAATLASWKKNGLTRNIKPTIMRKSTSTVVYNHNESCTADRAILMLHNESTAASHTESAAIRGQAAISDAWDQAAVSDSKAVNGEVYEAELGDEIEVANPEAADLEAADPKHMNLQPISSNPEINFADFECQEAAPCASPDLLNSDDDYQSTPKFKITKRGKGRNRLFTHEETRALKQIFNDVLRTKKKVSNDLVVEKLDLPESAYFKKTFSFDQIIAKIRYLKKIGGCS